MQFCAAVFMRRRIALIVLVLVGVLAVSTFRIISVLKTSGLGPIVRWCLGEPVATQRVNDAADKIISAGWDQELINLSNQLMEEYASVAATLPENSFAGGRLLPLDRLPHKFRKLGGTYGDPDLVLQMDNASTPTASVLSWGNMRHAIIIYAQPPNVPPEGFFVRPVNDRIYVVANES